MAQMGSQNSPQLRSGPGLPETGATEPRKMDVGVSYRKQRRWRRVGE